MGSLGSCEPVVFQSYNKEPLKLEPKSESWKEVNPWIKISSVAPAFRGTGGLSGLMDRQTFPTKYMYKIPCNFTFSYDAATFLSKDFPSDHEKLVMDVSRQILTKAPSTDVVSLNVSISTSG